MDVRGKLVELFYENNVRCDQKIEGLADDVIDIIAHSVTTHEWISVKEHLPQENEPEGTLCETVQVLLNNGKVSVGWCNRRTKLWYHMPYDEDYVIFNGYDNTPVIAWKPLAQPPKGE